MSTSFVCEYCNKTYTSLSNLNYHKKTAKFCIEKRNINNINTNVIEKIELVNCEYCNKEFTSKKICNIHLETCKEKKKIDDINEKNLIINKEIEELEQKHLKEINNIKEHYNSEILTLKKEIDNIKSEHVIEIISLKKEIDNIKSEHVIEILNFQKEISELKLTLQFKDEKLQIKDERYHDLEKSSKEKLNIMNKANNKPQVVNIQFNQTFEKTVTFDDESARNKFHRLHYSKIINTIGNKVDQNFSREFALATKDFAICTDQARGTLYIKDKDGKPVKKNANAFVANVIKIARVELNQLCNAGIDYLQGLYESDGIEHEDFAEQTEKLMIIRDQIKKDGTTDTVIKASRELVKNCIQVTKQTIPNEIPEICE
jgi:hypothetical protein